LGNTKTRLINALKGIEVDRPPFIGPGGMMNMATTEILKTHNLSWPQVHEDAAQMAWLAARVSELSGIDNIGIPFCMTLEAEALGAAIDMGSIHSEPKVAGYPLHRLTDWRELKSLDLNQGRIAVMIQAVQELQNQDKPVVVSLTGPLSLAASLLEPMIFFKSMRSEPTEVNAFLSFLSASLIEFARELAEAGADILTVADPSASGEILGPRYFAEFAVPYLNQIMEEADKCYSASLLHICGQLNSIFKEVGQLSSLAFSIDSATSVKALQEAVPGKVLIGNVSTHLLHRADPEKVKKAARLNLTQGVKVLAPACGISMSTPLPNLQAMAAAVREWPLSASLKQELSTDDL